MVIGKKRLPKVKYLDFLGVIAVMVLFFVGASPGAAGSRPRITQTSWEWGDVIKFDTPMIITGKHISGAQMVTLDSCQGRIIDTASHQIEVEFSSNCSHRPASDWYAEGEHLLTVQTAGGQDTISIHFTESNVSPNSLRVGG